MVFTDCLAGGSEFGHGVGSSGQPVSGLWAGSYWGGAGALGSDLTLCVAEPLQAA